MYTHSCFNEESITEYVYASWASSLTPMYRLGREYQATLLSNREDGFDLFYF